MGIKGVRGQGGSGRRQVAFSHGGVATAGSAMRGVGMGGYQMSRAAAVVRGGVWGLS